MYIYIYIYVYTAYYTTLYHTMRAAPMGQAAVSARLSAHSARPSRYIKEGGHRKEGPSGREGGRNGVPSCRGCGKGEDWRSQGTDGGGRRRKPYRSSEGKERWGQQQRYQEYEKSWRRGSKHKSDLGCGDNRAVSPPTQVKQKVRASGAGTTGTEPKVNHGCCNRFACQVNQNRC